MDREPEQPPDAMVDTTFRSGSLTAVGILLGFSLSFLTRWSAVPGSWSATDLVAVALIVLGTGLQLLALARLLSADSLVLARHQHCIRLFLAGLILVTVGVLFAVFAEIAGAATSVFKDH